MEPENPRPERHRRSQRPAEMDPQPSPQPAEAPSPAPARSPRSRSSMVDNAYAGARPPEGMERGYAGRKIVGRLDGSGSRSPGTPSERIPKWLTVSLVAVFMACLALLAGEQLMSAFLKQNADAKRSTYRAIVEAHPAPGDAMAWVERYAAEYNLQPAFVSSIILNESSWNPFAESRIGARGMMQLMEDTASWINDQYLHVQGYSFQMMWDPETNIRFGCWYLSYLSRQFGGDHVAVTAAYHAGQGTVRRWLANTEVSADGKTLQVDLIPAADTQHYARKVMRDFAVYDALYFHAFNSGDTAIVDPDLVSVR